MRMHRTKLITTAMLVIAAALPVASHAQNATDFQIKGSDTLLEVMRNSIKKAQTTKDQGGVNNVLPTAAPTIWYEGTGSGAGETAMQAISGTFNLGTQSIAGMSRNFKTAVLTRYPSWTPGEVNVVALDAATIVTKGGNNRCKNVSVPVVATNNSLAQANDRAAVLTFGTAGTGYTQLLEVVLTGVDGSGSVAACSDPKRVQAVADLAACQGVTTINHIYRRDDSSGTNDTFKERLFEAGIGGRFCNGAAAGTAGGNKANPNLNNQDNDPIRRPCDVTGSQVACTDATGALCANSNPASGCTQGLVTAISFEDPGVADLTKTIGARVAASDGSTMGLAGAAATSGTGADPAFLNKIPPSVDNVRGGAYMLARRLYLQRGPSNTLKDAGVDFNASNTAPPPATGPAAGCVGAACGNQRINVNATTTAYNCPSTGTTGCTGGGQTQRNLEDALFNFMTQADAGVSPNGVPGKCNIQDVVTAAGFFPCTPSCLDTAASPNLCALVPYETAPTLPSACLPSGTQTANVGVNTWNGGARWSAFTATAAGTCCSTGAAVAAGGSCTAANSGRVINSACSTAGVQAECAAGLTCTDIGGGNIACQ
jgi:ABC-type phosphate transport system substrate-binding protein